MGVVCAIAGVGAAVGFGAWLYAPPAGYRWSFEGEGPSAPYTVDLPLVVCGVPVAALLVHLAAGAVLRRRWARLLAVGAALVLLGWCASVWMGAREPSVPYGTEGS